MINDRRNHGVSEIIGTILLLGITVSLFSVLQIYVLSAEQETEKPKIQIGGRLESNRIILQHLGGESLSENLVLTYQINDSLIELSLATSNHIDDNKNLKWDVGEIIEYTAPIESDSFVEAKVVDGNTNQLLFISVFQQGSFVGNDNSSSSNSFDDWWDTNWQKRIRLNITTGEHIPYKNYKGYTVQFTLDTDSPDFLLSCEDLRIIYQLNDEFLELDREVINKHSSNSNIRFNLQENISANSFDNNYYLYYSNPSSTQAPHDKSNIYLWYDSAEEDREEEYIQGRVDRSAHGSRWGNTVEWIGDDYYDFDTGDNFADSLRPSNLIERDIYIEYEIYQTDAFSIDMTTGPLLRWIGSGSGDSEDSSHFFYYEMANSAYQSGGYDSHDDITADDRNDVQIEHGELGEFPQETWTRIGFASWGTEPTNLKSFYNNESGGWDGYHFQGTINDNENAGQFGVWIQQDRGRIKNILARRYIEPEPIILEGLEEEYE